MHALQNSAKCFWFAAAFLILCCPFCFAQSKVDIEVTVQPSSKTARGGENFSYIITVKNIGQTKATDVRLIQDEPKPASFVTYVPSKGECEVAGKRVGYGRRLYCDLKDMEVGETIITSVEVKINDFGDSSKTFESENAMPQISGSPNAEEINRRVLSDMMQQARKSNVNVNVTSFPSVSVYGVEQEENEKDNSVNFSVDLLPSLNIPPRVQILSPKNEAVIVKQVNKASEIVLTIKAFDPDGKIEKVLVGDPEFSVFKYMIIEDNHRKIAFQGKTYTLEEFDENPEIAKLFERTATLTGKDIYTYTLKNLSFGANRISIAAIDDGGRHSNVSSLSLDVKGDAEIKITSPTTNQVFTPNSTIIVETTSQINDSALLPLRIDGTQKGFFYPNAAAIPILQQTSKIGNIYKNQYVWKNMQEGVHNLKVMLFHGKMPTNFAETVTVVVAEQRIIKIFSLKDGQEFEAGKPVKISIDATDVKGRVVNDEFDLLIDGEKEREIYNSRTSKYVSENQYKDVLDKEREYTLPQLEPGIHTVQVIAKQRNYGDESPILGKSEIIKIKIK